MPGKADIKRKVQPGDHLHVVGFASPFASSRIRVGDVRTVRTVSANLLVWDCGDSRNARTEIGGRDVAVSWIDDATFAVAYTDGPTITMRIVKDGEA